MPDPISIGRRYAMRTWALVIPSFVVLGLFATLTLACGSSTRRQLQSVAITPVTASGQDSPNGRVQFVASGTYNTSPKTVTLSTASWGVANLDGSSTTAISVDSTGVAQCSEGASGTYAVGAWDLEDPSIYLTCASQGPFGEPGCNAVLGTAKLSCP